MKKPSIVIYLLLAILPLLLQGCAGTQIARKDLDSIATIEVARYKTPDLSMATAGGFVLQASGGWLTAPLGVAAYEEAGKTVTQRVFLPDYGELFVRSFMRIAPEEIQGWPKMVEAANPVEPGYENKGSGLIVFHVDKLVLSFNGLFIQGDFMMKDPDGHTMLQRSFMYRSWDFGAGGKQEKYLANNCKLLIEEIPIAAERTAKEIIIKHLMTER
jgi:hypothetical protein